MNTSTSNFFIPKNPSTISLRSHNNPIKENNFPNLQTSQFYPLENKREFGRDITNKINDNTNQFFKIDKIYENKENLYKNKEVKIIFKFYIIFKFFYSNS